MHALTPMYGGFNCFLCNEGVRLMYCTAPLWQDLDGIHHHVFMDVFCWVGLCSWIAGSTGTYGAWLMLHSPFFVAWQAAGSWPVCPAARPPAGRQHWQHWHHWQHWQHWLQQHQGAACHAIYLCIASWRSSGEARVQGDHAGGATGEAEGMRCTVHLPALHCTARCTCLHCTEVW